MKTLSAFKAKRVHNSLEYIFNFLEAIDSTKLDVYPPLRVEIAIELITEDLLGDESVSNITKRYCVRNAIERYLTYKKYASPNAVVELFQEACEVELRKMKRNISKYSILMFLNTNPITTGNYREITILGNTLQLMNWSEINYLDVNEAWKWLNNDRSRKNLLTDLDEFRSLPSSTYFLPLVIDIYAIDISTAIETAIERFNLLRCFFNIPLIVGNSQPNQNNFRAISKVKPSPYHLIFDEKGKFLKYYSTIENYDYKTNYCIKNQIDVVNHLLTIYKTPIPRKSSLEHFRIVLLLYQKALDSTDFSASYLAFWRVLEKCVTFGKERISYEKIIKRISHLCSFDSMINDVLNIIVDNRNKFVHLGEYPELVEDHKIYRITKLLAEHTINELYELVQVYSERNQLSTYVEYVGKDKADLIKTKSIVDDIVVKKSEDNQ